MYNFFFFFKFLRLFSHADIPAPAIVFSALEWGSCLSAGPVPARNLMRDWLQNWVAAPSTGSRVLNGREDLLRLKFKVFQEFTGKIQDISTNAVQTHFWENLQLEQSLLGFERVGKRLKSESQVTPSQMVFIFLLQNKSEVKRNQNRN